MAKGNNNKNAAPSTPEKPKTTRGLAPTDKMPHVIKLIIMTLAFKVIYFFVAKYVLSTNALFGERIRLVEDYQLNYVLFSLLFAKYAYDAALMFTVHTRKQASVLPPDQHVYKVANDKVGNYVILENDGAVGKFNRAQRGVSNFLETYPVFVSFVLCAGPIFPFPVFVAAAVFSVARVIYSFGYTLALRGRIVGFLFTMQALSFVEALVLVAALHSSGFGGEADLAYHSVADLIAKYTQ